MESEEKFMQNIQQSRQQPQFLTPDIIQNNIQKEEPPINIKEPSQKSQAQSQKNNTSKNLRQIYRRIRLKVVSRIMVNQTNSRMLRNLAPLQYYLINDQSMYLDPAIMKKKQHIQKSNTLSANIIIENEQFAENRLCNGRVMALWSKIKQKYVVRNLVKLIRQIPIISPSSNFKIFWDMFYLNLILVYIFLIPLHICFDIPFNELISEFFENLTPLILIFDTVINLSTSYFDNGIMIRDKMLIFMHYLKTNIVTDILAVIPNIVYHYTVLSVQTHENGKIDYYSLQFIGKFFLLFFFMKLNCFSNILKKLQERSHLTKRTTNIIQLVKLLFTIIIIAHLLACLWILMARIEGDLGITSWMESLSISAADPMTQYIRAYYFSVVTMITVGYGDISAKTDAEMILSVISIMISCGIYAYLFNEVGQIFNEFFSNKKFIQQNLSIINQYMFNKGVSKHLQYQVRDYLEYYWKHTLERDPEQEKVIINLLSNQLKEKLLIESNKIVLKDSPIFSRNFCEKVIQKTVSIIQENKYTPEEIIINEGQFGDNAIYFVESGNVEMIIPNKGQKEGVFPIQSFKKGEFFCAESFFTGEAHRFTFRSKQFSTLLLIKRRDFINLLKDFPDDYEHFCVIKDNLQLLRNFEQICQKCMSCGSFGHSVIVCPFLHFIPKKNLIIQKFNKACNSNEREPNKRDLDNKKSNSLANFQDNQEIIKEYQEENEESIQYYLSSNSIKASTPQEQKEIENLYIEEKQMEKLFSNQFSIESHPTGETVLPEGGTDTMSSSNSLTNKLTVHKASSPLNIISNQSQKQIQIQLQQQQSKLTIDKILRPELHISKQQESRSPLKSQMSIKSSLTKNQNAFNIMKKKTNYKASGFDKLRNGNIRQPLLNNSLLLSKMNFNISQPSQQQQMNKLLNNLNINTDKDKMVQSGVGGVSSCGGGGIDGDFQWLQFSNQFECLKNYKIYQPFNNLTYQCQLLRLGGQERQFFMQRVYLDNILFQRKQLKRKKESTDISGQDTMNKLILKYQQQQEQEENDNKQKEMQTIYKKSKYYSKLEGSGDGGGGDRGRGNSGQSQLTNNQEIRSSRLKHNSKQLSIDLSQIQEKNKLSPSHFNKMNSQQKKRSQNEEEEDADDFQEHPPLQFSNIQNMSMSAKKNMYGNSEWEMNIKGNINEKPKHKDSDNKQNMSNMDLINANEKSWINDSIDQN